MICMTRNLLIAGLLLFAVAGCGGSQGRVSGQVTLDGQPLTKGDISFSPVADGVVASGQIDSGGNYSLKVGTSAAIPPGSYRVTVVAVEPVAPTPEHPEPLPTLLTPKKYNNPATSELSAEVKAGSNTFNFDLKSMP
jgi:hypothetical protein